MSKATRPARCRGRATDVGRAPGCRCSARSITMRALVEALRALEGPSSAQRAKQIIGAALGPGGAEGTKQLIEVLLGENN